jgi:3-hydroxybutyryl-CoA dehydratase
MSASFAKTITDADITVFAGVSGDTNPVAPQRGIACGTAFKGPARPECDREPDPTRWAPSCPVPLHLPLQTARFSLRCAPARRARHVTIREIDARSAGSPLDTICQVAGKDVLVGEAMLLIPDPRKPGRG